jgi:hydroxymethylglutaryl-CoA synthase
MGWLNPATIAQAKGEKAVANFDEDSITMAVAAGLDCIKDFDRSKVDGVFFASTSMPYKERLNAGIINVALGLRDQIRAADFAGGIKAGTSSLLSALESVGSASAKYILVCSAESRLGKPASPQEMIFGDAGAAMLVGNENVIAEFKGSFSTTYDFVDHYRGPSAQFDRQWEDRWIRDEGFARLLPEAIKGLLDKYRLKMSDFHRVIYPCIYPDVRKKLNTLLGFDPSFEQSNLQAEIGECGSAHPLVMLAAALEQSKPGDKLLLVGYGSGCDAMWFETTENISRFSKDKAISRDLTNGVALDNYSKYLVWRDILPADIGMRSEEDMVTRFSVLWRKRREVLGLWGSKCKKCNTAQYPQQRICVNPDCNSVDEMDEYLFSDKTGHVASYTGDMLAPSINPPAVYGHVQFEGGGKYLFDFTDCELNQVKTGMPVVMSFRRKYRDINRGISEYFWKAVPKKEMK